MEPSTSSAVGTGDGFRRARRTSMLTKHGGAAVLARKALLKKKKRVRKKKPDSEEIVDADANDGAAAALDVENAEAPALPLLAAEWDFVGEDGDVHGPHLSDELLEWRHAGWFNEHTLVAPTGSHSGVAHDAAFVPFDTSELGAAMAAQFAEEGDGPLSQHTDSKLAEWRAEHDGDRYTDEQHNSADEHRADAQDSDDPPVDEERAAAYEGDGAIAGWNPMAPSLGSDSDDGDAPTFADSDDEPSFGGVNPLSMQPPPAVGIRALDREVAAWTDFLPGERIAIREGAVTWHESNWRNGVVLEVLPSAFTHRYRLRVAFTDEKEPAVKLCGPFGDFVLREERHPTAARRVNAVFDFVRQRKGYFATLFLITALATIEQVVYLFVLRTELWVHEERVFVPAPTPAPIAGPIVIAPTPMPTFVEGVRWDIWASIFTPVCLIMSELKVLLSLLHDPILWTLLLTLINIGQITYIAALTFMHAPMLPLLYMGIITLIHVLSLALIPTAAAFQGNCVCGVHVSQRVLVRSIEGKVAIPVAADLALTEVGGASTTSDGADNDDGEEQRKQWIGDGWSEREKSEEVPLDALRAARTNGTNRDVWKCILKAPSTARASDFTTGLVISLFFLTSPQVDFESFRRNGTLGYQFMLVAISFVLRVVFVVLREAPTYGEKCQLFVGLLEILLLLICIPCLVILNVVIDLDNLAKCCLEEILQDGVVRYDAVVTFFDIGLSIFLFFFILFSPRVSSTSNFIATFAKCVKFEG